MSGPVRRIHLIACPGCEALMALGFDADGQVFGCCQPCRLIIPVHELSQSLQSWFPVMYN